MKLKPLASLIIIGAIVLSSTTTWAHSGRTDRNGCHVNRRTGTYHCH